MAAKSNANNINPDQMSGGVDGLNTFLNQQGRDEAKNWLQENHGPINQDELDHRLGRYGLNPCGEIIGADFHCNLAEVHLNQIEK